MARLDARMGFTHSTFAIHPYALALSASRAFRLQLCVQKVVRAGKADRYGSTADVSWSWFPNIMIRRRANEPFEAACSLQPLIERTSMLDTARDVVLVMLTATKLVSSPNRASSAGDIGTSIKDRIVSQAQEGEFRHCGRRFTASLKLAGEVIRCRRTSGGSLIHNGANICQTRRLSS